MLRKLTTIGYTAALVTTPAWVTACSTPAAVSDGDPSVLFSVSAERMHFENPQGMDVTLVMEGVDLSTIWFTDRPARESGAITTGRLAAEWDAGGTFAADPPNAALVLHDPVGVDRGKSETLVAEMKDVDYDEGAGILRAEITVLSDDEAGTLDGNLGSHGDRHDSAWPRQAGAVSLFIDSVSMNAVAQNPRPAAGAASPATSSRPTYSSKPGGIVLCSNPSSCESMPSNSTYTVNETIYFQSTVVN